MRSGCRMENKNLDHPTPLASWRIACLIFNFVPGYEFVYPQILRTITLWMDPHAHVIPQSLQFLVYIYMILISLWLGWPLLKESFQNMKSHWKEFFSMQGNLLIILLFSSVIIGKLIQAFTSTTTSANQAGLNATLHVFPFVLVFSSLLYAPIVEEILFRGVIFRTLRGKFNFWIAAFISSFSFGFIHVFASFSMGNLMDFIYIFQYAMLGFLFCVSYEKNKSIVGSISLHFLNNAIAMALMLMAV